MSKNYVAEFINGGQYLVAVAQTNEVFQIIELVASIVVSLVLIAYRLWRWYKEAKKDGKITKEEIEEANDIVSEGAKEIKGKEKHDKDEIQ